MTRISSYAIYQCPSCGQKHVLPNYASISITPAIDAFVVDEDLRTCFGCGTVKPFGSFLYLETIRKPSVDTTPGYIKFIKHCFGIAQPNAAQHPAKIYPYLQK